MRFVLPLILGFAYPCYAETFKPEAIELNDKASRIAVENPSAALPEYDKSIAADPNYYIAYSNKAVTQLRLKRYDDALKTIDKAIALRSNFAEGYFFQAQVNREAKRSTAEREALEKSLTAYNKRLEQNPSDLNSLSMRPVILFRLGNPEAAQKEIKELEHRQLVEPAKIANGMIDAMKREDEKSAKKQESPL